MRALSRCCQFDVAEARPDGTLAVRRKLPPLTRRQVMRLSPELVAAHQAWQEAELLTPAHEQQRRRSRRLALSLIELGEDAQAAEDQLARWRFHPALCREAAAWAAERHRSRCSRPTPSRRRRSPVATSPPGRGPPPPRPGRPSAFRVPETACF